MLDLKFLKNWRMSSSCVSLIHLIDYFEKGRISDLKAKYPQLEDKAKAKIFDMYFASDQKDDDEAEASGFHSLDALMQKIEERKDSSANE